MTSKKPSDIIDKKEIESLVKKSVQSVLESQNLLPNLSKKAEAIKNPAPIIQEAPKKVIVESKYIAPKGFTLKTEKLSGTTKTSHDSLYRKFIEQYNQVSLEAESKSKDSDYLRYRSLSKDLRYLLNAIKLHELYFGNISDMSSSITFGSLPYTKLSRDFATFEKWQQDFIACCLCAREGWAVTYYDPYLDMYVNGIIEGNDDGLPLGAIPVIVLDMWSHSYFYDYGLDKKSYIFNMMQELNWRVNEARMAVAEQAKLNALFKIQPTFVQPAQDTGSLPTELPLEVGSPGVQMIPTALDVPANTKVTQ